MSGLKETTNEKIIYVNIKEGKLVVRLPDKSLKEYACVEGIIKKVLFVDEEYDGKKFEKAKFYINDIGETLLLQMRTDSGYFRGLCNSLRSASYPKEILEITPHFSKADGKTKTTCFVKQNGVTLKHFFTKNNMGDFPQLEIHEFKGQTMYDNIKQIDYWKNWMNQTFPEIVEEQKQPKLDFGSESLVDDMPF